MNIPTPPWERHAVGYQDWQTSKTTAVERAKHVLMTGLFADCQFLVGAYGSGQELIKAHKNFLAMSSPEFHAMFFGKITQGAATNEPIPLPELTPSSFRDVLQYIYTDTVKIQSMDQALSLSYAAKKCILPHLVAKCVQYMMRNLGSWNTCKVLDNFKLIDGQHHLKARCLSFLREQTQESLNHPDFENLSQSTMLSIVRDEEVLDIREVELLTAVMRWAKRQCSKRGLEINGIHMREVLCEIIPQIRFLTMTQEEFESGPALSGILTEDECWTVKMSFDPNLVRETPMTSPVNLSLSRQQRRRGFTYPFFAKESYCLRLIENATVSVVEPIVENVTSFTVDRDIQILGIYFAETDYSKHPMIENEDVVLNFRFLNSNGTQLSTGFCKLNASQPSTTVFDRYVRTSKRVSVDRNRTYRIIISATQRAFFVLGKASPFVYCQENEFQFKTNNEAQDGLVRGFFFLSYEKE